MGRISAKLLALLFVAVALGAGARIAQRVIGVDSDLCDTLETAVAAAAETPGPKGWLHLDTGQGFGFYAPMGAGHLRRQGIDSAVGEIAAPGFRLQYDFGFYSNSLEGMRNEADYSEYRIRIDGRGAIVRKATLRQGAGPRYLIGLYVERADWVWGLSLQGAWRKLGIMGAAATEEDRNSVERLFTTIRFDRPLPVTIRR